MIDQFSIVWNDRLLNPKCEPNPDYPEGIDLDPFPDREGCVARLPYPAARIGYYTIVCNICGNGIACTTAGRPDDPRSIKMPCGEMPKQ